MSSKGIVVSHEVIESSLTLENAIEIVLKQLHPTLESGCGSKIRSFCSPTQPMMLIIEDINKAGRGPMLVEKIAGWREFGQKKEQGFPWRILCPVWPQLIQAMGQEALKRVSKVALWAEPFDHDEGRQAVIKRRLGSGAPLTHLQAASICKALGHEESDYHPSLNPAHDRHS